MKCHTCPHCSRAFSTSSDLTRHRRVHTGEKPYKCTICTRSFTQKNALNIHMNQHSGLRPYTCRYCPNIFSDPSSKRRHEKEKHENFQHYCPISGCVYKNKRKPGLVSHLRTEHKILDASEILGEDVDSRTQSPASPAVDPFAVSSPAPKVKKQSNSPPLHFTPPASHTPVPALPPLPFMEPLRAPSASDVMLREFLVPSVFDSPRASHSHAHAHAHANPHAMPAALPFSLTAAPTMPTHFTDPWNLALLMPHAQQHVRSPFVSPLHTPHSVSPSPSRIPSPAAPLTSYSTLASLYAADTTPYAGPFEFAQDAAPNVGFYAAAH